MILREEYDEAYVSAEFRRADLTITSVMFTTSVVGLVESTQCAQAFGVVAGALGIAVVVSAVRLNSCRSTIRAWRDQKRAEAIMAEMKRDGGP